MYPDSPGSPVSRDCRRLLHGTTADDPFLTDLMHLNGSKQWMKRWTQYITMALGIFKICPLDEGPLGSSGYSRSREMHSTSFKGTKPALLQRDTPKWQGWTLIKPLPLWSGLTQYACCLLWQLIWVCISSMQTARLPSSMVSQTWRYTFSSLKASSQSIILTRSCT